MSKFDTCVYSEYFGEYSQRLCNHPNRGNDRCIDNNECRKCRYHVSMKNFMKECPFCGGKSYLESYLGKWHAKCSKCKAEITGNTIDSVREKWNTRV